MTLQEYFLESEKRRPEKAVKTYPKVPAQSAKWHKSRNGALSPNDVTPGSHRKVWWQCDKGHSWEAPVYYVAISGSGCPYCRGLRAIPGETDLLTLFPEKDTSLTFASVSIIFRPMIFLIILRFNNNVVKPIPNKITDTAS